MRKHLTRRRLITSGAATAALAGLPPGLAILPAMAAPSKVRMTTGKRGAHQSISWMGAEAGIFKKHDLDVTYPAMEVGGLKLATGLMRGDWEFYDGGLVPLVENVLTGGDAVALLGTGPPHLGKGRRHGDLFARYLYYDGQRSRKTVRRGPLPVPGDRRDQ